MKKRFPENFCFQLSEEEFEKWRCQNVTSNSVKMGLRYSSYAFTEQGVSMLSAVLKSEKAIEMSIRIMNAFISMKRFLKENADVFYKFQQIDQKLIEHDKNFEKVFNLIQEKDIKPDKGIFYDGEVFDAHKFVADLISSAKSSIILVDNYIDTSVLTLMSHKKPQVKVKLYTKTITEKLKLAEQKFNTQYGSLELEEFNKAHDRFLIIDNQVYHIGASLKDLGKKWFAFSKFTKESLKVLERV